MIRSIFFCHHMKIEIEMKNALHSKADCQFLKTFFVVFIVFFYSILSLRISFC